MLCIAEHAFADAEFDFLKLACINRNWNEAVDLFIKRLAKEEYPDGPEERRERAVAMTRSSLLSYFVMPLWIVGEAFDASPRAGLRMFYRCHDSYLGEALPLFLLDYVSSVLPAAALRVLNRFLYAYHRVAPYDDLVKFLGTSSQRVGLVPLARIEEHIHEGSHAGTVALVAPDKVYYETLGREPERELRRVPAHVWKYIGVVYRVQLHRDKTVK